LINTINIIVRPNETDIKNDFVEMKTRCTICKPNLPCNQCTVAGQNVAHTSNIQGNTVELFWIDTQYEIAYDIYLNGNFVATVGKNTTSYTLKNLQSTTRYSVAIVARNNHGGRTAQTIVFKTTDSFGWLPAIYYMMN